jgi:hypothetical protein
MLHNKKKYHSLSHSIQLLKYIKEKTPAFEWKEGKYEAFNDKKAIELLVGDKRYWIISIIKTAGKKSKQNYRMKNQPG